MLMITCWGTRGSIPVSGSQFENHGGSTTCIEIQALVPEPTGPARIIIDGGTGLATMANSSTDVLDEALFLQTHVHWDHIQGYPFFSPFFRPGARFDFLSVSREGQTLEEVLRGQMRRPLFPVALPDLPAELNFGQLARRGVRRIGGWEIEWTELCHPSGSTGFRLSYAGHTVVFSGDVEVQMDSRAELVELARGADLLIMDAQYFPDEYEERQGFGHSTPIDAVEVAIEAGVQKLLMTHHHPTHDDRRLQEKVKIAQKHARRNGARYLQVDNARDEMECIIGLSGAGHRVAGGLQ